MGIVAMGFRKHLIAMTAFTVFISAPSWAQAGNGVGTPFELAFWQSVAGSDDPAVYEAYLQQYPDGTFSGLAKAKAANLRKGTLPATVAVTDSAPPVAPKAEPAVSVTRGQSGPVALSSAALEPVLASAPVAKLVIVPQGTAPTAVGTAPRADDSALLEELAKSQEVGGATLQVAAAQGFALPARPVMHEVPDLPLPKAFCSAEQRNAFHETRYKPVMEIASANNAAAVAHMQHLQQVYDSLQMARDPTPMNAVANEARVYQEVAASAYNRQIAIVQQFQAIMAVPVTSCQMAAAK